MALFLTSSSLLYCPLQYRLAIDTQILNSLPKACQCCQVLSQDAKNAIYFCVRQLEMQKSVFSKSDIITFTSFGGNCTAKNEDIALVFCVRVVCMYSDNTYSGF